MELKINQITDEYTLEHQFEVAIRKVSLILPRPTLNSIKMILHKDYQKDILYYVFYHNGKMTPTDKGFYFNWYENNVDVEFLESVNKQTISVLILNDIEE